jgi:subtilisin family serine protease
MKRVAGNAAIALLAAACADAPTTPPSAAAPVPAGAKAARTGGAAPMEAIPEHYIVVFNDEIADVPGVAARLAHARGAKLLRVYDAALKGMAIQLPDAAAAALAQLPEVAYVEQDQVVTIDATQSGATWGIDRIDQRSRPLSTTYTYTSTGSGVRAYIIDTGIYTSHSNFGGRASNVYDALGGSGADCNGHGTHVAGTVGSATWGVAKGALLRGVRVLNCSGSGSTSGIIAGINWVASNHIKPAVANMSLGGGYSSSLNTAANNLASAGVFLAVAAGNSNANACNYSPASAANATTVASSTSSDAKSSFSNYGSCVDLYAPGSSITSTWLNGGTNTISGTSMASPHVAGVAALYKATYGDASYSTIRSWLVNNATSGVITGNPTGTPNRLLYKAGL